MKKYLLFIILFCFTLVHAMAQTPDAYGILYVKKGSTGTGDSWTNAIGEVADALKAAATNATIKQIWVAGGIYKPMYSPVDYSDATINNTFLLVKDVQVYGGFAGTEATLAERNLKLTQNSSVLNGDIGVQGTKTDNAVHLVLSIGDVGTAALNGFTISDAYSIYTGTLTVNSQMVQQGLGAGLYVLYSSPLLSNLTVISNTNFYGGTGMYIERSTPVISNIIVSGNYAMDAGSIGGGFYLTYSPVTMTNAKITGNKSGTGGGMCISNSPGTIANATISGNNAPKGGGVYLAGGQCTIVNSILSGNITDYSGYTGTNLVSTKTQIGTAPGFVNAPAYTNAPFITGDYRLLPSSGLKDKGDATLFPGLNASTTDLEGNARVDGVIDVGAYEYNGLLGQTITAIPDQTITYGAAPIVLPGTSSSGLPVRYISANNTIATAYQDAADGNKWKAAAIKTGIANFTAIQEGNTTYYPANDVAFRVFVYATPLTITATDVTKNYDGTAVTGGSGVTYSGFVNDETGAVLTGTLAYTINPANAVQPGFYTLTPRGLSSANYLITNAAGKLTILPAESPDADGILYVKKGSTGTGNSWENATGEVADALNAAYVLNTLTPGKVTQIWVAGGSYLPAYLPGTTTSTTGPRDYVFTLVKDVKLFGGFAGTETSLAQRDLRITDNISTLNALGTAGVNTGNSYHIVLSMGNVGTAELNGFDIVGSYGNISGAISYNRNGVIETIIRNRGGGIHCIRSSPILKNLNIRGHSASTMGSGIYNNAASPVLYNVTISGNICTTTDAGVALYNLGGATATLVNVTIGNNTSKADAVLNAGSTLIIRNSIIYGNRITLGGQATGISSTGNYTTDVRSSLVETMAADPVNKILNGNPQFVLPLSGVFSLQTGSPAIDAGDNSYYTDLDATTTDQGGNPRLYGTAIDLGAFEFFPTKQAQTINAPVGMISAYGEAPFEPGVTATSNLTIQYASSDNTIATAFQDTEDGNKWKIKILKAGIVTITVSQPGDATYDAAPEQTFEFTISKAPLTLTTKDVITTYNGVAYTGGNGFTCTGLVNNDDETVLTGTPVYQGTSQNAVNPGFYDLTGSGLSADNYDLTFVPGRLAIAPTEQPDANGILYVKKGSTGTGNSWSNAVGEVATALNSAAVINTLTPGKVTQVWVAGGRYLPAYLPGATTNATTNRDYAFSLVKDVKVYGGFAGTETTLAQRDLRLVDNTSILSGYIGAAGSNTNNSYHIVTAIGNVGTAELNGFAIVGGYADNSAVVSYTINGITEGIYQNTGAGIYCVAAAPILKNLNIRGNTTTNNGTGIYSYAASPKLYNVTISGNLGSGDGIGIYNAAGSITTLVNITVSANSSRTASTAAAIMNASSDLYIYNSIIWSNNAANVLSGVGSSGGSVDIRSSLVEKMAADPSRNILDGNLDPKFVSGFTPSSNVSTTGIYYLNAGSPAINTGDNSYYLNLDGSTTDQGGNPRVSGSAIDMGAYEYGPTVVSRVLYVKKGATGNGSSWNSALGEVAAALRMAILYPGTEEIWVAGGTYQPKYGAELDITSTDARDYAFILFKDIKIYGGFAGNETSLADRNLKLTANKSILDGDMGTSGKAYHVVLSLSTVNQAEINGFTITHGMANGTGNLPLYGQQASRGSGGGIANFSNQLNLSHLDIIDNATIQNTFGTGFGGGIYSTTPLTISYSNISNNRSSYGGGIFNSYGMASLEMTNVAVTGNSATGLAGGLYNAMSQGAVLKNVLFSGNATAGQGGGIYNERSPLTLINTTISGNRANGANGGGAMFTTVIGAETVSVINSIVYGNSSEIYQATGTTKFANSLIKGRVADADNPLDGTMVTPNFVLPIANFDAPTITGDYTLQSNSAVINAGNNTLYPGLDATTKDLAGNNRVTDFATGGVVDLGAYEYAPAFTPQTISAIVPVTKVYGDAAFEPGATATSNLTVQYASSNNAIATASQDAADGNKWKIKPLNAGTVTITATQPGDATYDAATPVTFVLTIDKATLTATANPASKIYDGMVYTSGYGVTYSGFVNNETSALVTGTPAYTGNSQTATNAGTYTITPGGVTAPNYTIAYAAGTLTISPAILSVTANAENKTYNGLPYAGGNGVTYGGFVNNETATVITGTPTYTGTSQAATNVGTYTITPGGLTALNYAIAYHHGTLTISTATLTATANADSKTYNGQAYTGGSGVTYTGFVNNETATIVTGTPTYTGTSQSATNAGTYTITPGGLTAPNYTMAYADGLLTVNPAILTVTADNQTRCFGAADPAFTYRYSGWVNSETTTVLSTLPVIHSTTGAQSPAGTYDLLPSGAAADNYTFTYVKGTLTVNALPVSTITAAQGTMLCGTGATLDLQASGGYNFTWKFNNAPITGATGSIQAINAAGSYTAIATDAIGCTAPASNSVVITQQLAPVAAFTYNSYCADKPVKFTNQSDVTSSGTVNYNWSSGDGANSNAVSPQFNYPAAGNYNVSLTITPAGCPALATTLTKAITVEAAIPGKTLDAVIATAGMPLQLAGRNFPGAAYSWSPADGLSNVGISNPVATLDQNQHFNLLMTFPSGCTTTDNLEVTVNAGNTILVPNVFSPNGDGQNDILYANLRGIKQLHYFKVYNRWGKLMFESADDKKGWNGRVNGELQPLATYIWTAEGVDISGSIIRTQGTVTLLR